MEIEKDLEIEAEHPFLVVRGWLIVCGLALAFLIYGLVMFSVVGDKGPPDWSFGNVEDIPGESIYSTTPGVRGPSAIPEPQHVNQAPPLFRPEGTQGK